MAKKKPTRKKTTRKPEVGSRKIRTRMSKPIRESIDRSIQSGRYLIAAFRMENGRLHVDRTTHNFPLSAFADAIRLLKNDLDKDLGL